MAAERGGKGPCLMTDCGQPAKVGGLCSACYSWHYRVRWLTGAEFGDYVERTRFRATRMLGRLTKVGTPTRGLRLVRGRKRAAA